MEDNKNLDNTQQNEEQRSGSEQEEKTFTQDEVDEIVKKRLARERKKLEAEPESAPAAIDREKALEERENTLYAKERFTDEGIPKDLLELVSGKNKKDIDNTIKILKPYIDKLNEPIRTAVAWGQRMGAAAPREDKIRSAMGLSGKR